MKCQECGKYDATTHITQIINGQKSEIYLCPYCAEHHSNPLNLKSVFDSDFENFFSGLWGIPAPDQKLHASYTATCSTCGSSLNDITRRGKLGCSECYTTFRDYLLKPLKEIHGSNKHIGKIPKRSGKSIRCENKIDKLKEELSRAVLDQNFEKAAKLRDEINDLKNDRG